MSKTGVIFILVQGGKILMQQRDEYSKTFPFYWCLPGGGSEEGEEPLQTLVREVQEEFALSLNGEQCTYVTTYDNGRENKVFVCRLQEDQTPELHEGLAMQWMTIDEIEALDIGLHQEGLVPLLRAWI